MLPGFKYGLGTDSCELLWVSDCTVKEGECLQRALVGSRPFGFQDSFAQKCATEKQEEFCR